MDGHEVDVACTERTAESQFTRRPEENIDPAGTTIQIWQYVKQQVITEADDPQGPRADPSNPTRGNFWSMPKTHDRTGRLEQRLTGAPTAFACYNSSGVTTVAGVMHPKYQTRDPIVRRGDSGFNQPDAPLVWAWPKTTCNCRVSSLFKWTNPNKDTEKLLLTFWIIILDARWLLLRRDEGGEEGRGLLPRLIIKLQDVCECVCVCSGEQTHFHHIIQRVFSCVHLSSASAHWWQVLKSVDLRLDNQILSKKGKKMSFLTLCILYFLCGKNGQWKGTIVLLKLN